VDIRALIKRPIPSRMLGRPLAYLWGQAARLSNRRVGVALCYHRVGDPQGDPDRELVPALGTRLFEAQLRHLSARYRVVPTSELPAAIRARRRGQRFPVSITFDDDLASHRRAAMPILERLGLPAAFFLCGASLERPFAFWWERLDAALTRGAELEGLVSVAAGEEAMGPGAPERRRVHGLAASIQAMPAQERDSVASRLQARLGPDPSDAGIRSADVEALAQAGFEIGFHTFRHHWLPALGDDALHLAMKEGRDQLEIAAGQRLTMIAYPHGGADARVAAAARSAGFELGFRTRDEPIEPDSDPLLLGRVEPPFGSVGHLALKVARALARGRWEDASA
jgi:peptidoglycan/xylan/chitin deacetylase (PgdA/CDA1 family)